MPSTLGLIFSLAYVEFNRPCNRLFRGRLGRAKCPRTDPWIINQAGLAGATSSIIIVRSR